MTLDPEIQAKADEFIAVIREAMWIQTATGGPGGDAEGKLRELADQRFELQQHNGQLAQDLNDALSDLQMTRDELKEARSDVEAARREIRDLRNQARDELKGLRVLQRKALEEWNGRRETLELRNETLREDASILETQLANAEREVDSLGRKLAAEVSHRERVQLQAGLLEEERDGLLGVVDQLKQAQERTQWPRSPAYAQLRSRLEEEIRSSNELREALDVARQKLAGGVEKVYPEVVERCEELRVKLIEANRKLDEQEALIGELRVRKSSDHGTPALVLHQQREIEELRRQNGELRHANNTFQVQLTASKPRTRSDWFDVAQEALDHLKQED